MDFVCVLSVDGSLLFYEVTKENEGCYRAKLKAPENGQIEEFVLERNSGEWMCSPEHADIGTCLIRCVEARPVEEF